MKVDVEHGPSMKRALWGTTLFALLLRLWGLTRQSLWIDEMFTIKYAGLGKALTWEMIRDNLHGPLHALLLHFWCFFYGWGEVALRLPHALISTATVPLFFFAARKTFGPHRALMGTLLLAVNPFHVWYAQEVRNYGLVIFFAVLGLLAMQNLVERRNLGSTFRLAVVWIAGLLSNLSMAFHLAGSLLWSVIYGRTNRGVLPKVLLSAAVAVVALLPWEIAFYQIRLTESHLLSTSAVPQEERLRGDTTAPAMGIPYALYTFSVGFSFGPSLRELRAAPTGETVARHLPAVAAAGISFGLLALVGLRFWVRGDRDRRLWLATLIVPFLLAYFAATRNVKVFNPRYVAVALPAYLMLIVDGAAYLNRRRIGTILFAAVLLISLISLVQMQVSSQYWREDARSAAAVLKREVDPGDLIFVVGTWDPIQRYYWPGLTERREIRRHFVSVRVGPEVEGEVSKARGAIDSARATYVLFYRDDFHDPEKRWEKFLRENYPIDQTWEFPGVRIWRIGREGRP